MIDISKFPEIAAQLGTYVPEGILWEAMNSGRDIDSVLMEYEYEIEDSGADAPSWLDDWDISDSNKVREAINVINGIQEEDPYGIGGPTNQEVAAVVDEYPELMDLAEVVEQNLLDTNQDTDAFDDLMSDIESAMEFISDEKVDTILSLMDSGSNNENSEAVLNNISDLLTQETISLTAKLQEEQDSLGPGGLLPDDAVNPGDLFAEQFPGIAGEEDPYGGYDNTTAFGAMVRHGVDYNGLNLDDAILWASGKTPPNIAGAQGNELPDLDDAAGMDLTIEGQDTTGYQAAVDKELELRRLGRLEAEAEQTIDGKSGLAKPSLDLGEGNRISIYAATTSALEAWDSIFGSIPDEFRSGGVPYATVDAYMANKLNEWFDQEEFDLPKEKEDEAAYLFMWLYKNSQEGKVSEELASTVSTFFNSQGLTKSLANNEALYFAKDLFEPVGNGDTFLFPTLPELSTHASLNESKEGQEYFENLIDAGRGQRDIFNKAFRETNPGLSRSTWYDAKEDGLFQDAMISKYFDTENFDPERTRYTGYDSQGSRKNNPFGVDEDWISQWLNNPYENQTKLFDQVSEFADFMATNSWGSFVGEDYARLQEKAFSTEGAKSVADLDKELSDRLSLDMEDPIHKQQFYRWKEFNPLLWKAGSTEYNAAVQAIKQSAVSSLTPTGASASSRASIRRQIDRDYDDHITDGEGSPLTFLQQILSGGRIVSSKSTSRWTMLKDGVSIGDQRPPDAGF